MTDENGFVAGIGAFGRQRLRRANAWVRSVALLGVAAAACGERRAEPSPTEVVGTVQEAVVDLDAPLAPGEKRAARTQRHPWNGGPAMSDPSFNLLTHANLQSVSSFGSGTAAMISTSSYPSGGYWIAHKNSTNQGEWVSHLLKAKLPPASGYDGRALWLTHSLFIPTGTQGPGGIVALDPPGLTNGQGFVQPAPEGGALLNPVVSAPTGGANGTRWNWSTGAADTGVGVRLADSQTLRVPILSNQVVQRSFLAEVNVAVPSHPERAGAVIGNAVRPLMLLQRGGQDLVPQGNGMALQPVDFSAFLDQWVTLQVRADVTTMGGTAAGSADDLVRVRYRSYLQGELVHDEQPVVNVSLVQTQTGPVVTGPGFALLRGYQGDAPEAFLDELQVFAIAPASVLAPGESLRAVPEWPAIETFGTANDGNGASLAPYGYVAHNGPDRGLRLYAPNDVQANDTSVIAYKGLPGGGEIITELMPNMVPGANCAAEPARCALAGGGTFDGTALWLGHSRFKKATPPVAPQINSPSPANPSTPSSVGVPYPDETSPARAADIQAYVRPSDARLMTIPFEDGANNHRSYLYSMDVYVPEHNASNHWLRLPPYVRRGNAVDPACCSTFEIRANDLGNEWFRLDIRADIATYGGEPGITDDRAEVYLQFRVNGEIASTLSGGTYIKLDGIAQQASGPLKFGPAFGLLRGWQGDAVEAYFDNIQVQEIVPNVVCDDTTTCPSGQVCGTNNGDLFGFPAGTRICWDATCNTPLTAECGSTSAKCGVCTTGSECTEDSDCRPGLICRENAGRHYDLAHDAKICAPPICLTDPVAGGCGFIDSPCGKCEATPKPCSTSSDCSGEEVCGVDNGGAFGLNPTGDYCWPCGDATFAQEHCGAVTAECGLCGAGAECSTAENNCRPGLSCRSGASGNTCATVPAGSGDVFVVALPRGPGGQTVAVSGGSGGVTVGAGVGVTGGGVLISGPGGVSLGDEAQVPTIISKGPVSGGEGVIVDGSITSGGSIGLDDGSTVSGDQESDAVVGDPDAFDCTQVLGVPEHGDVVLVSGRGRVLLPGSYRDVVVADGATLYLTHGRYQFDALVVHPGGRIVTESAGGYTVAWVRTSLQLSGVVEPIGAQPPKLFIGYAGAAPTSVAGRFWGTLYAPNSQVSVASGADHRGAIVGVSVNFASGTALHHHAAPLRFICGVASPSAPRVELGRGPIRLVASEKHDSGELQLGTSEPGLEAEFRIPHRLLVSKGNAGNYVSTLSFTPSQGTPVTCRYRGGSQVPNPGSRLQRAGGLQYRLVDCDGGLTAGQSVVGSDFELEVHGDRSSPTSDRTEVELNLGVVDHHQGQRDLPSFIDPEVAIQMREDFSWQGTAQIPELNADGTPALYYATIWIKNAEEYDLLDRLLIHHQDYPLFHEEFPEDLFGSSGNVRPSGDESGTWVFAVIPGATYNRIRSLARGDVQANGDTVLFDAIVLRSVPAGAEGGWTATAVPILSYDALRAAGFRWRLGGVQIEALPDPDVLAETSLEFTGSAATFIDALEYVYDAAAQAVELTLEALAWVDSLLAGTVNVDLDFNLTPQDDRFTGDWLPGAFGPNGGRELAARGVSVDFFQVSSRVYTLGFAIPTLYSDRMNESGQVHLEVANADSMGITWFGGLCISAHNDTARLSDFPGPPAIYCSFPDPNLLGGDHALDFGFDEDVDLEIGFDAIGLQYIAEMNEARDYAISVLGMSPRKAHVLKGLYATALSAGAKAWAPCLRTEFTWLTPQTVSGFFTPRLFNSWVGFEQVSELYFGLLNASDIIFAAGANSEENRGIATHEYGHFILCNLVADKLASFPINFQSDLWQGVIWTTVWEGLDSDIEPDNDTRIVNESFADMILAQVAGGTNYFVTPGSDSDLDEILDEEHSVAFCDNRLAPVVCLDANFQVDRNVDDGDLVMRGLVTNMHDVFDGHYGNQSGLSSGKRGLAPTNADFHVQVGGDPLSKLEYTVDSYGNAQDEYVSLPGSAVSDMVAEFLARAETVWLLNPGGAFSVDGLRSAMAATMRNHDVSWCDACRVMALHEPGVGADASSLEMWRSCMAAPFSDALGSPPDPELTMSQWACEPCGENARRVTLCTDLQCSCVDPTTQQECTCDPMDPTNPQCPCDPRDVDCHVVSAGPSATTWEATCEGPAGPDCSCTCRAWEVTCRTCSGGQVPVQVDNGGPDQECVACPAGSIVTDGECHACGLRDVTVFNVCHTCAPGEAPNAARNACVLCPVDAVASVGDVHCSAIVQYAPPPANDVCPGDFWVEVTSAAGEDLYLSATQVTDMIGTACTGSSILVEAVWGSGSANISSTGQVNETGSGCVFPDELRLAAQHLTGPVRVRIAANPGASFHPALAVRRGEDCELPIP